MYWPLILGQGSLQWLAVFLMIHQPALLLWECWKPLKTLDQMSVTEVWQCYNDGELADWRGGPMVTPFFFLFLLFLMLNPELCRTNKPGGG